MPAADAYVLEVDLELVAGCDPAAVGAAVTVELCGHWEHEGACRWPHYSSIDAERDPASFRTLYVCDESERGEVEGRIEASLRAGESWRVLESRARPVSDDERPLAERLLAGPRSATRP